MAHGMLTGASTVIYPSYLVFMTASLGITEALPSKLSIPLNPTLHLEVTGHPVSKV